MVNILIGDKRYDFVDFESEKEFEKAVIENSQYLFGKESVYIDEKKRFGNKESHNKGIPDGYVIDFASKKHPQLYFVENELSTHDIYGHISEQLARFSAAIKTSSNQIRIKLLGVVKSDQELMQKLVEYLKDAPFSNVDELMDFLVDRGIKIVLIIDEATSDLNDSLDVFRDRPDVVTLKRYSHHNEIAYVYEPLREELQDLESKKKLWKN